MKKKSMFKNLIYVLFILSILFLFGCAKDGINDSTPPPMQNTQNGEQSEQQPSTSENNENAEPGEEDTDSEDVTTEDDIDVIKYYVDSNFLIKPLNPEDDKKVVLLTFDDAPRGDTTNRILDTLDKYNAKALFFVNGIYVKQYPEMLKEIAKRGHTIGTHTWNHTNLTTINTKEETYEEIVSVNDLVEKLTGERPVYFRPPNGSISKNEFAKQILRDDNMQTMNWSLGSKDWIITKPEQYEEIVHQVLDNVYAGANILMHDREITANVLDDILAGLKENGLKPVLPTEVIIGDEDN